MTQPALSSSIRALEKDLNFHIFNRSSSGIELTEKGKKFYEIALQGRVLSDRIAALSDLPLHTDDLSLAAAPAVCQNLIFDATAAFRQKNPNLKMQTRELRPYLILQALEHHEASLAVTAIYEEEVPVMKARAKDLGFTSQALLSDSLTVYLSASSRLRDKKYLTRDDLKEESSILYLDIETDDVYRQIMRSFSGCSAFSNSANVKEAVSRGMGYALLPGIMTIHDIYLESGRVCTVPLRDSIPVRIYLISRPDDVLTVEERDLIAILKDQGSRYQKLLPVFLSGE